MFVIKNVLINSYHNLLFYTEKGYSGYLPTDVLEAGLKTGRYIQGHMNVNKSNASEEAFVRRKRYSYFEFI